MNRRTTPGARPSNATRAPSNALRAERPYGPGFLGRRASLAGRLARLDATPDLHHRLRVSCLVLVFAACLNPRAAEPTAQELAAALQKKYDDVRAFTADFVHTYRGGVLNRQLNQRGRLMVKKPGKMRWEYTAPEKNLFVSDGVKIYSYVPADRQVIVTDMPASDHAATPALFLAGKGNLSRDFTPSLTDPPVGAAPGSRALKLVPKTPQSDYDWLVVVVDPVTLALQGLVYGDQQGGTSSFFFTNLKENAVLADKSFEFRPPRGVDVITGSSVR